MINIEKDRLGIDNQCKKRPVKYRDWLGGEIDWLNREIN